MMKKQVIDLEKNEVIVCRSEQEAKQIRQLMHDAGLTWSSGKSYTEKDNYFDEIVYNPYSGTNLCLEFAKKYKYIIHEAKDFLNDPSELIGKKIRGFKFDNNKKKIYYLIKMNEYLGEIGIITKYFSESDSYSVEFKTETWNYPADLIHQHLVEEITLPLVKGVPDVSNCGIEMYGSNDRVNWYECKVYSYNSNSEYRYESNLCNFKFIKQKDLKQITRQEAEKLLNGKFKIID